MGPSEWISLSALAVAGLALWRGERRAAAAKRAATERNIVDWTISWPSIESMRIVCEGPDEAKRVFVQLIAEGIKTEADRATMRRGDVIDIPVPHLSRLWDERDHGDLDEPGELVNIMFYGGRITWYTPAGSPVVLPLQGVIQGWRNYRIRDTIG